MTNQMQGVIVQMLVNVVLALLGLAGAYATYYIKKATDKVKLETDTMKDVNQKVLVENALDRLEVVAEKTVTKFEETAAKQLRKAVQDGKVDRSELENLAHEAYAEIISTMEPDYLKAIQESLGDARTYILNTIEEKVKIVKQ